MNEMYVMSTHVFRQVGLAIQAHVHVVQDHDHREYLTSWRHKIDYHLAEKYELHRIFPDSLGYDAYKYFVRDDKKYLQFLLEYG